ncbi:uncharacterized protein [Atheta coriaria]|uniref:uncharacterized protein n=1 Tax=Dalotia coriaria TaxID=877792 RepID=UPI0031F37417
MRRMRRLLFALTLIFQWKVGVALHHLGQQGGAIITTITRQNNGDLFAAQGVKCSAETCIGLSSGTADVSSDTPCTCQCHSHLPAFREDLQICVDDIHECVLSPFVSGSTSQQIPFVFLPLKGQIIHPSKEISFAGIQTPLCAVSGAKFLTDGGWIDLRNPIDTDVPFRLFRDEGRTFLQWVGEPELRNRMGGRLVLVHLMCREIASSLDPTPDPPTIFTPCVAFRVVGTPMKYLNNVSEVVFAPDTTTDNESSSGLSVSEYVAIGICSVLLGLIYVASVFLYLHIRRRRKEVDKTNERNDNQGLAEEGVVKNNPLLNLVRHFPTPENTFSDSNSSDTEPNMDVMQQHEERKKNIQLTSVMIHPQYQHKYEAQAANQTMLQESIERLPEENVSIVETVEGREDRPDSVKIIGTARRKLYFNPAYFEPHLLIAPPPAAIEFLTKIREVICIAKQKMAAKKFTPNLIGIPEEDPSYLVEVGSEFSKTVINRRGSSVSLKRENSRRKTCTGCPGCEPQEFNSLTGKLPQYSTLGACENCALSSDSKQQSIRKWLEDVPVIKQSDGPKSLQLQSKSRKLRSPTRSLSPDHLITPHIRKIAPRPAAEPTIDCETKSASSNRSNRSRKSSSTIKTVRSTTRPKAPPPLPPTQVKTKQSTVKVQKTQKTHNIYDVVAAPKGKAPLPPPDMIHEAIMLARTKQHTSTSSSSTSTSKATTVAKPIINKIDNLKLASKAVYEADSLERTKKGFSTPPEYVDVSSSQPSPSLSGALPMDEEMTMQNAIINTKTGNMTISKLNMSNVMPSDDHDYELIVLKKGNNAGSIFKLPELLQRKNTGYSLVSEVYVNNGYNYSSQPSTPTDSDCSTLERAPKIIYEPNKPGHLLIEVEDCPDNYIRAEESDAFEPDTLDRKPKMKLYKRIDGEFIDSLERPKPIMLRTNGTFKKDASALTQEGINEAFEKSFSSLREIYEAKIKKPLNDVEAQTTWPHHEEEEDYEGRILTLEERHSKRQRKSPISIPPDIIPPDMKEPEVPIYEHPKPPRPVENTKPPLPPKNGTLKGTGPVKYTDVSILNNFIHSEDVIFKNGINNQLILQASITNNVDCPVDLVSKPKKIWKKVIKVKQDDSGYLSTDSNESHHKKKRELCSGGSETDESLGDGQSESGAESIETHSVFFGSFRKTTNVTSSLDSGVGSDSKHH